MVLVSQTDPLDILVREEEPDAGAAAVSKRLRIDETEAGIAGEVAGIAQVDAIGAAAAVADLGPVVLVLHPRVLDPGGVGQPDVAERTAWRSVGTRVTVLGTETESECSQIAGHRTASLLQVADPAVAVAHPPLHRGASLAGRCTSGDHVQHPADGVGAV